MDTGLVSTFSASLRAIVHDIGEPPLLPTPLARLF
jgi:hypothetical protein